mgnify:CR=1 FL=1
MLSNPDIHRVGVDPELFCYGFNLHYVHRIVPPNVSVSAV